MKLNIVSGVIILILLMGIALAVQTHRVSTLKDEVKASKSEINDLIDLKEGSDRIAKYYINQHKQVIAVNKSLSLNLGNIQKLRKDERLSYLNEFSSLHKKLKNLESTHSFDITLFGDSIPVKEIYIPCKDTLKAFHYILKDEFNDINAVVLDTPVFNINVPVKSVLLWKRKKKFLWWRVGSKEYFIESFSPNKLVKINNQELIRVDRKE